jgi:hypothetical protein
MEMNKVILETKKREGQISIVLAELPGKGEWVTWIYNAEYDGYSGGHYFSSYEAAKQDFDNRN